MDPIIKLLPEIEMENYLTDLMQKEDDQLVKVTAYMFNLAFDPTFIPIVIRESELLQNILEHELDLYRCLQDDFFASPDEKADVLESMNDKITNVKISIDKFRSMYD